MKIILEPGTWAGWTLVRRDYGVDTRVLGFTVTPPVIPQPVENA